MYHGREGKGIIQRAHKKSVTITCISGLVTVSNRSVVKWVYLLRNVEKDMLNVENTTVDDVKKNPNRC
jgi:hypothetical protein